MARFDTLKNAVTLNCANKISDADAGTYVNASLSQIWSSFEWSCRKADVPVATVKDYSTGTVAVTQASGTVTGTGTTWVSGMVNRWLRVGSAGDLYKITAFSSTTSITIENPQGGTGYQAATATAQAYTIFQHVYDLGTTVDRVLLPSRQYGMIETTREQLDRIDPLRQATDTQPRYWCPREWLSTNNNYQIEFYPRPSTAGIIRVPILKLPPSLVNASDDSLIRQDVVEHLATFKAALFLANKFDPNKYLPTAQLFWALYNGGKQDTEGGSLAQAIRQDQEKFGMIGHVRNADQGVGYSDDFLSSHDMEPIGSGGWF